jgi:hypothetical protein
MRTILVCFGALLLVAPLFCQSPRWIDPRVIAGKLEWFHLLETESEVRSRLGQPAMVADFGGFRSWQYRFGEDLDHDEFSHALLFRKSDGKLVSISRTFQPERTVDEFFPLGETVSHSLTPAGQTEFRARIRRLPGGGLLMAMGTQQVGQATHQIVLMHESVLPLFYPSLEERLNPR